MVESAQRMEAPMAQAAHQSKMKLLDAALNVVRTRGYAATRVDDICEAAGVTKGSFFHHFDSKDDLALAAAAHWRARANSLFTAAAYNNVEDPVDRLLGYLAFRKSLLAGALPECTCFAGTVVQEAFTTHPQLRDACGEAFSEHTALLVRMIDAALSKYRIKSDWTAQSLALHIQGVIQGGFVLAKVQGS